MIINGVEIIDTYAEAFRMWTSKILVTADTRKWAKIAVKTGTGFATSIIACGCEGGWAGSADENETPDGRPGEYAMFFTVSKQALETVLLARIGQCIMTSPTSACYNALSSEETVEVGDKMRFFGDGFQISKIVGERRFWRIPVMQGEFLVEDRFGVAKGIGGGNFLILGKDPDAALVAAEAAVEAMLPVPDIILPFPGGIARSGSKVGSRYKFLKASTNTEYCPTIRSQVTTNVPEGVNAVLELIIDGLNTESIKEAMRRGIRAACIPGVKAITAGNYGGRLGQEKFYLHDVLEERLGSRDGP